MKVKKTLNYWHIIGLASVSLTEARDVARHIFRLINWRCVKSWYVCAYLHYRVVWDAYRLLLVLTLYFTICKKWKDRINNYNLKIWEVCYLLHSIFFLPELSQFSWFKKVDLLTYSRGEFCMDLLFLLMDKLTHW